MLKLNYTAIRRFLVFGEPHVADPAWLVPVVEVGNDSEVLRQYNDAKELLRVATKLNDDLNEQAIRRSEAAAVLKTLGISQDEYRIKLIQNIEHEKKEQADLDHQIATAENEGM